MFEEEEQEMKPQFIQKRAASNNTAIIANTSGQYNSNHRKQKTTLHQNLD